MTLWPFPHASLGSVSIYFENSKALVIPVLEVVDKRAVEVGFFVEDDAAWLQAIEQVAGRQGM